METWYCSFIFQDLYVYLTEENFVKNLSSTKNLIWKETGIQYGNWYSGEKNDGSIEFHHKIKASKVISWLLFGFCMIFYFMIV